MILLSFGLCDKSLRFSTWNYLVLNTTQLHFLSFEDHLESMLQEVIHVMNMNKSQIFFIKSDVLKFTNISCTWRHFLSVNDILCLCVVERLKIRISNPLESMKWKYYFSGKIATDSVCAPIYQTLCTIVIPLIYHGQRNRTHFDAPQMIRRAPRMPEATLPSASEVLFCSSGEHQRASLFALFGASVGPQRLWKYFGRRYPLYGVLAD